MGTKINIIVAIGKDWTGRNVIGKNNKLLWHIGEDLRHFRHLTLGHPIIMGRKTFESIGKPLLERQNFVITHSPNSIPGVTVVRSLKEAIGKATSLDTEIFIIGGGEIYKEALPITDRLYITRVETTIEGDTFFPNYEDDFKQVVGEEKRFDKKSGLHYSWLTLER